MLDRSVFCIENGIIIVIFSTRNLICRSAGEHGPEQVDCSARCRGRPTRQLLCLERLDTRFTVQVYFDVFILVCFLIVRIYNGNGCVCVRAIIV